METKDCLEGVKDQQRWNILGALAPWSPYRRMAMIVRDLERMRSRNTKRICTLKQGFRDPRGKL